MDSTAIRKNLQIKKLQLEDIEQFNALLRYAFQVTDEELVKVGWEKDEIKRAKFPILRCADVLGWFDKDKLASQIAIYPMQVNIQGEIYDMGLVTGVATYPEYAGLGLMSDLLKKGLRDMRTKGQSISFLYPYSIPFYRHKGWEVVSDKMTFTIKDSQLPKKAEVPGMVRRVAIDTQDLIDLHNQFAKQSHGCLIRDDLAWEEYWRWEVEDILVAIYYSDQGEALGYIVYRLENEVFIIKEMVYLNEEARKGLWGYITAHYSMIDEVRGDNYSNHSISFLLEDSDIKETIQPYIMARIVDFEQFIINYRFHNVNAADSITFVITDKFLEWNNGTFTIELKDEEKPKLITTQAEKVVYLNIQTLATMLMGYKRPTYLRRVGRLQADEKTVRFLEYIIPKETVYFSDYI